jgi:hypothetical protein
MPPESRRRRTVQVPGDNTDFDAAGARMADRVGIAIERLSLLRIRLDAKLPYFKFTSRESPGRPNGFTGLKSCLNTPRNARQRPVPDNNERGVNDKCRV